jgi:hypothetical protein
MIGSPVSDDLSAIVQEFCALFLDLQRTDARTAYKQRKGAALPGSIESMDIKGKIALITGHPAASEKQLRGSLPQMAHCQSLWPDAQTS